MNEKSGFCFSHDPARKDELSEAGRNGARALHKRYSSKALSDDELPLLRTPNDAAEWLETIGRAVSTGRLTHQDATAATRAVQQWLVAWERGAQADEIRQFMRRVELANDATGASPKLVK